MAARSILVILTLVGMTSVCLGDAEQKARFEQEYPGAVKRLEARFARVKGSCRMLQETPGDARPTRPEEMAFAADHGSEKVEIRRYFPQAGTDTSLIDPHADIVYCVCSAKQTVFYLARAPGQKTFVVRGRNANHVDASAYTALFGRYFKANHGLFGMPMSEIMKNPGFRLIDAERLEKDGRELVKVEFAFDGTGSKTNVSLVLDPDDGWVTRSGAYQLGPTGRRQVSFEVEYGPPSGGAQGPRRVTFHEPGGETSCEFVEWRFEPTPEDEFKTSHYELPDVAPESVQPRSTLPYWLAGLAVAGLVLALVIRRVAVRR